MDTERMRSELAAQLDRLGIGHQVETVRGAHAAGVLVRSPYADPLTVVEDAGHFALLARGTDGHARTVDTEIRAGAPVQLLALYLAFHALWAMKRLLDREGVEAVARANPAILTHQQLALAFIASGIASDDTRIRDYAQGLMASATQMLKADPTRTGTSPG